ncbi:MAG: hypothetical protein ACR2FS_19495 [Phormidesmis sp.]
MAMNWEILKTRYLQTSPASQMDSLSLNLIRLQTLADSGTEDAVAHHLVRESQFFIEWTVAGLNLETELPFATELLSLQRQLSRWKLRWPELWNSEDERQQMAETAQHWCKQLEGQTNVIAS